MRERPSVAHTLGVPAGGGRLVRVVEATVPALVLGTTQPATDVVAPADGVEVVRRRSGGGAVHVTGADVLWVDVGLPADDPLWVDDVGRSFAWLGDVWAEAVGGDATVHRGPLVRSPLSAKVCFAGLGPGEVSRPTGGKVVGMAQRRTRDGALFQCACLLRWDPVPLAAMLDVDPQPLLSAGAPAGAAAEVVLRRFFAALPLA